MKTTFEFDLDNKEDSTMHTDMRLAYKYKAAIKDILSNIQWLVKKGNYNIVVLDEVSAVVDKILKDYNIEDRF